MADLNREGRTREEKKSIYQSNKMEKEAEKRGNLDPGEGIREKKTHSLSDAGEAPAVVADSG